MAQTSIHFQPVRGGSEEHNKREKQLDYVHHERTHLNDYWEEDTQANRLAFVTANAKAKTGRKMQAKATPIREAVVVIEDGTTMDDLKKLSDRLHERFGIDVFQIAIHRDEGYKKSNDGLKLNLHAHLVADWTDHQSGKSLKLSRQDMSEMQTITAQVLHMERGVSSDRQHLSAIQFKEEKAKAEAEKALRDKEKAQLQAKEAEATRDEAERKASEAQTKAAKAEARAVGGFLVDGVGKARTLLGFGKEAKALKEVPKKIAEAEAKGRAEAVAEVCQGAGIKYKDMSKVTPDKVGRDFAQMRKADKEKAQLEVQESNKKLSIIQNMAKNNYTYDEAAKLLKEQYADINYYKETFGYCGTKEALDYKSDVFDPLCEAQGAHRVSTTENAIGRRNIVAQGIIVAAIHLFDAVHLERLANSLKAMAEDFNLGRWLRRQNQEDNQEQTKVERKQEQGMRFHR